jgi:hypothetical protein
MSLPIKSEAEFFLTKILLSCEVGVELGCDDPDDNGDMVTDDSDNDGHYDDTMRL